MKQGIFHISHTVHAKAVVALLCMMSCLAINADESLSGKGASHATVSHPSLRATLDISPLDSHSLHPGTPMVLNPLSGAFTFDLGGSDTPKLQLQLAHPLVLEAGSYGYSGTPGTSMLGMDATIRMPIAKGLSLQGTVDQAFGNTQFHSLGSIQCLNGTLKPDSYTASGCRFVSDSSTGFDRRTLNLSATHESESTSASVNWFTTQMEQGSPGVFRLNQVSPAPMLDNRLLMPISGDRVFPGAVSSDYITSEATGIDLNFQVGFATSQSGAVELGLALTRVLDANYQEISGLGSNSLGWSLAEGFNSAALGVEWVHGAFSSGIRGYYREPVSFLNRENLGSESTFDVHFTWRAPWRANLSIGASNVLGAGVSEDSNNGKNTDRFESIYGRIPYVRYQQDL